MSARRCSGAVILGSLLLMACSSEQSGDLCSGETDSALCARLILDCGLLTAYDNCGRQRTVNCGSCAAPAVCGGSGVANVCGAGGSGGGAGTGGASGSDAGTAGSGGSTCTGLCPTKSHWIKGSFALDYAKPAGTYSTGELLPLVGETIQVVVSFDEGAQFKDPPANNEYSLRIVASGAEVQQSGDATGLFEQKTSLLENDDAEVSFDYGTQVDFAAVFSEGYPDGYRLSFSCLAVTSLSVGTDQYVQPGPVSCASGTIQLGHSNNYHQSDYVTGKGAFEYQ